MLSATVGRGRARFGGKSDECVGRGRLDPRKAPSDCPAAALHRLDEWIGAAGVENDEAQAPRRIDGPEYAIERDGFVLDIKIARQRRVDRDQVVDAVDLDAVSRVVNDCDIAVPRRVSEITEGAAHLCNTDIAAWLDDRKAGTLEECGHRRRVINRIRQPSSMSVIRIP